ncbi:hypothetical protein ACIXNU_19835 [Bacteroides fragilis]
MERLRSRKWKTLTLLERLRSRKWKGTLTLLESHVHVNGKVRSRKWKGTLTLLEKRFFNS